MSYFALYSVDPVYCLKCMSVYFALFGACTIYSVQHK